MEENEVIYTCNGCGREFEFPDEGRCPYCGSPDIIEE